MKNYQILIDEIRCVVVTNDYVSPEHFKMLADDYESACHEMLQRLKMSTTYLRSGNTAEALRLADAEPNLLDIYHLLDFPERELWVQRVTSEGYKPPPLLPYDQAQQLNDAYMQLSSIEPLLKKYRHLALVRAPLVERLDVLRNIVAADPLNTVLVKDQEQFEQQRIKALAQEVEQAVNSVNVPGMQQLQKELNQPWCIPLPKALKEKLQTALRGVQFKALRKRLDQLVDLLKEAHARLDPDKGNVHLAEMQQIINDSGMAIPVEVIDAIEPDVAWLDTEKKRHHRMSNYETALSRMQQILKHEVTLQELKNCYHALVIAANDASVRVPVEIVSLYENEVHMHLTRARKKKRLVFLGLGIACLGAIIFSGIVLMWYSDQNRVAQTVETLNNHLALASLEEAEKYQNELERNNRLMSHPEVAKLYAELKSKITERKQSRQLFDEQFEKARKSLVQSASQTDPNATIMPDLTAFLQAEKLASGNDEKMSLETIRPAFVRFQKQELQKAEQLFLDEVSRITGEFNVINQDVTSSFSARQVKLNALSTAAQRLAENKEIGQTHIERARRLQGNINLYIQSLAKEQTRLGQLKQLTDGIGNIPAYKNALNQYIEKFSNNKESAGLSVTLGEASGWEQLIQREEFNAAIKALTLPESGAAMTNAQLVPIVSRLLGAYHGKLSMIDNSVSDDFKKYAVPYLESVKSRSNDALSTEKQPFEALKGMLKELSQKEVWPLYKSPNSTWYYLVQIPAGRGSYQYINGMYATPRVKNFDDTFFENVPKTSHYSYSIEALKTLDNLQNSTNWNDEAYVMTRKLYQADGIDPLIKLTLIKEMITEFSKYDTVFAQHFRQSLVFLEEEKVTFYTLPNWWDGEAMLANPIRDRCKAVLARITFPVAEELKKSYDRINSLIAAESKNYRWIGFVMSDGDKWRLMTGDMTKPFPTSELYIVRTLPPDNVSLEATYHIVSCNRCDSVGTLSHVEASYLIEGTPVFVIDTQSP